MNAIKATANQLADLADRKYVGASIRHAAEWDLAGVTSGRTFTYRVVNNSLENSEDTACNIFRQYLGLYEVANRLRDGLGEAPLATPLLSLPVTRSASGFQSLLSLANHNEYDYKRSVDAATSRSPASLVPLAVGRIAQKYRLLLEEDSGQAKQKFLEDPLIKSLSSVLMDLGYSWDLVTVNPMRNEYDVRLTKQGTSFLVSAASSGEKELLTYLFAIYALNVKDALIIVDEPELHLHPSWQKTLLRLFEKLADETGNQFLLATHSPVFVSPSSIQYVSRVFSQNQQSSIIRLNSIELPDPKHLFGIINSQNNERIFFSNKVILVEGLSDRLFFEALFQKLSTNPSAPPEYEIVSVNGKGFFPAYRKVLNACKIKHAVIADLDYVNDIGRKELGSVDKLDSQIT